MNDEVSEGPQAPQYWTGIVTYWCLFAYALQSNMMMVAGSVHMQNLFIMKQSEPISYGRI